MICWQCGQADSSRISNERQSARLRRVDEDEIRMAATLELVKPEVEELNLHRYMSYLLPTSGPAGSDLDRNRRHGTHLGFDLPQIKPGR